MHILIGTNADDLDAFDRLVAAKLPAKKWVVPKQAAVGDPVIFYFWSTGFYARGKVASIPVKGIFQSGPKKRPRNVMRSDISNIQFLETPLARTVVAEQIPEWGWARMRFPCPTTPPEEVKAKLIGLIKHTSSTSHSDDTEDDVILRVASSAHRDRAVMEGIAHEGRALRRSRNRALRQEALRQAAGVCAACGVKWSEVLDGLGESVLHVHHRKQLALARTPRKTAIEDLAVVCSNCHSMIHVDPDAAIAVEELQKRWRREGLSIRASKRGARRAI